MISPDGRERIVDHIQFTAPAKSTPPPAAAIAEPRDFSLDDGPIHFSVASPTALINGEKLPDTIAMTSYGALRSACTFTDKAGTFYRWRRTMVS